MKTYELHCQDPWFSFIKNGQKNVEGRKNLPKFKRYMPGDRIVFSNGIERFSTTLVAKRHYPSIDEYLEKEGFSLVLPGAKSIEEAKRIYLQWSSEEEIKRFGFLALEIAL